MTIGSVGAERRVEWMAPAVADLVEGGAADRRLAEDVVPERLMRKCLLVRARQPPSNRSPIRLEDEEAISRRLEELGYM